MSNDVIKKIVKWLKAEIKGAQARGFVLGLSGGLDSAVCAALIKLAASDSLGLILPIESELGDIEDAEDVAANFDLDINYLDLTYVYNGLLKLLPDRQLMAQANLKARLRMIVLYYYANCHNYLVCGTGNKTERLLGYFTKFGDGACDVLPLGDLYKCEVRNLAEALDIPKKIIKKVPSAGLWPGQTDEAEIGFSYEEIDKALQEINRDKIVGKVAERLNEMIIKNEHKQKPPKICYLK